MTQERLFQLMVVVGMVKVTKCVAPSRRVQVDEAFGRRNVRPVARPSAARTSPAAEGGSPKRKVEIGRDSRPCSGSGRKCGACCPTGGDRASISQAATNNFVAGVDCARTGASSLQERDDRGPPPHVPPCTGDDP
jgi:hypothetical protein